VLRYFVGLGTWGFGGPIATVGYMQRDLVERRSWLDRQTFLDGVALGQTMPGPLAAQVAMWVGFVRARAAGALAVAGAFIAPSFAAVLVIAALYRHYQGLKMVTWVFHGVAPVVIAIIAVAAYKLARLTNRTDVRLRFTTGIIGIVRGGLSTTMELVAARRPFLYFPLAHHWEQQHFVAHRLDHYRAGVRMDYANTTPPELAAAIRRAEHAPVTYQPVRRGGAHQAAAKLASLISR
jgi:putative chromate ion transporter